MKTIAVLGIGNRGGEYALFVKYLYRKWAKIVSICDINQDKLKSSGKKFGIKEDKLFSDATAFFSSGVLADALIIATQDMTHYEFAKKAIETGYKYILLEKPVSANVNECLDLERLAKEYGTTIIVCHVLRYSGYFSKIKELIESGIIGKTVAVKQVENIGYYHFCHSYVRGEWRNTAVAAPSIMAKCCHDLDLIYWYANSEPISVSSLGGLKYFHEGNAPEGATSHCMGGCSVKESCPFDAEAFYITDPFWKAKFIKYLTRTVYGKTGISKKEKREILSTGKYGRCVYKSDNNVCDFQNVNIEFENGIIGSLTMTGLSAQNIREVRIIGTLGEIVARNNKIKLLIYGKRAKSIRTSALPLPGHIDGDFRTVRSFVKLINGKVENDKDITTISATVRSHKIADLAEISRKNNGEKQNY